MSIRMDRVLRVLPKEEGAGRRGVIRNRPDVGEIVCDLVLSRRPQSEIAKRAGVDLTTVQRFKQKFITDEVRKVVMAEASVAEQHDLDDKINSGQDDVQQGLRSIIKEQKEIYGLMKDKIADGRDVEDLAPALGQLLRDQGQSFERLLKSYTALKERTTVVLSINESPEWSKLQEVLFVVFEQHPEAFDLFRSLVQERRLRLE
ncbi:MAG: hypothetical protein KDK03_07890 [Rhodobacteraceae bacterium]|nr:hypothetical protein [Paracoccaceae bacterium]